MFAPPLPSPPRFLHGTVISPFPPLDWIFSCCHKHGCRSPLVSAIFPKVAATSTRRPSRHPPSPSFRLLQGTVVRALLCNPDSSQPKSILSEIWDITQNIFYLIIYLFFKEQAFHLHCLTSFLPPLFSPPPATCPSPLSNQETVKCGKCVFDVSRCDHCRVMLKERGVLYFSSSGNFARAPLGKGTAVT